MVAKVQMQAVSSNKPRGRPKKDIGLAAAIEADRWAMTTLEEVAKSSALNINCIMQPQQASLIWHLYISLIYLVTPPPMMPPPRPQTFNVVPYGAQSSAAMPGPAHQQHGFQDSPIPHQFSPRDQQHMHPPAGLDAGHRPMEPPQMHTQPPVFLPRSGQSMKFSFQQPTNAGFSPNGGQNGMPPPGTMPPPSVAISPSGQQAPGPRGRRPMPSASPVGHNGYPHPGAVVEDR